MSNAINLLRFYRSYEIPDRTRDILMSALFTFTLLGIGAVSIILNLVLERYTGLKYFFGSLLLLAAILALGKLVLTPNKKAQTDLISRSYAS